MEVWAWIVAYVLGFGLLQLLVYRYFRDGDASVDASVEAGERQVRPVEGLDRGTVQVDDEGTHCRHCGAYNEAESTFRYCQQCVSPLR